MSPKNECRAIIRSLPDNAGYINDRGGVYIVAAIVKKNHDMPQKVVNSKRCMHGFPFPSNVNRNAKRVKCKKVSKMSKAEGGGV